MKRILWFLIFIRLRRIPPRLIAAGWRKAKKDGTATADSALLKKFDMKADEPGEAEHDKYSAKTGHKRYHACVP
jgi:hypothetical protein